ncbi:hypothetical protein Lfu02_06520 [Longispora fulva]|uniref:Uncharacterized protein n=1 Tax=Longispora fulva TaxID=619741 RepID=A0A8J7GLY5_9ACTN|nr:hypothetical protein [Longispora fulva]MBG6135479.1 hypothetical protein [Longispora fulva]GIG56280.1 hypothetical protein Lfu02_06520 [Longispora fulva]
MTDVFDAALRVADAVLYEGYLLYPYRASAAKNQARWQFGVLVPPRYAEASGEPSAAVTECLLEPRPDATVRLRVRFLQLQARTVERRDPAGYVPVESLPVDGRDVLTWEEAVDRQCDAALSVHDLLDEERVIRFDVPEGRDVEPVLDATGAEVGRLVRRRWPVRLDVHVSAERFDGPYGLLKLRVRVANASAGDGRPGRDRALRRALISAHTLLAAGNGTFVSLLEPPEWARPAAASCHNEHTYPVLVGEPGHEVVLSSPIILYDHPHIAPESPGDLFDALEIDEILTLRTMTLTDAEKREARATDDRAAAILDRVDTMPAEVLDRLHGAVRYLRRTTSPTHDRASATAQVGLFDPGAAPWWDPAADAAVDPDRDSVTVAGVAVARGTRVRLRPGARRSDAQDIFLAGRDATVEAVLLDVDDVRYLAVTLDDDPAADLHRWHGRYLYFSPDEVEPLRPDGVSP